MKNLYVIILMLFSFTMSAQQTYNFEHHEVKYSFVDHEGEYSHNLKETDKLTFYDLTAKIIAKETNTKDFALKLVTEDLKTAKRTDDYYELKVNCRTSVTKTKYFVAKSEDTAYKVYVRVTRYFTYLDNN